MMADDREWQMKDVRDSVAATARAGSDGVTLPVASPGRTALEKDHRLVRPHIVRPAVRVVVVVVVFMLSFGIRLDGLDLYATADEGYWMHRSIRFGAALARGDFASTFRAGHPGVSVMWTGILGIGPERLAPFFPEPYTSYTHLERAPGYLEAFSAARRGVAALTAVLVTLAVVLAWRLFGGGPALVGGAFLVLDPYVIGMTRLLHVEALLAPLMTVSALAGLVYWMQSPRWGYLLLSLVTGGLALLTKAPAGFLPVFFGLVCLAGVMRGGYRSAPRALVPLLLWGIGAAMVYVALFPALWLDPVGQVTRLIDFVVRVGLQPHDGNFFLGMPIWDDPGPLYYAVALPLRLSPLVALGVALLTLRATSAENRAAARWLLAYVVLFAFLMTLGSKKFDRYMLPALMVLDLLAGVGVWRLATLVAGSRAALAASAPRALGGSLRGILAGLLVALLTAVQAGLLVRAWPYPIAYYNPLAGGPERARDLVMVGWGEGLEQAADFLNGLPNAESLYVVSSYQHVVRPRFVGTTIPIAPYVRRPSGTSLLEPDYVVLYVNGLQRRQIPLEVQRAAAVGEPAFVAQVNGLPYAWVYQIPRSEPRTTVPLPAEEDEEADTTEN